MMITLEEGVALDCWLVVKYWAMAWVARRRLSKVKSRAIRPRQPLVPNLIMGRKESSANEMMEECAAGAGPVRSAFPVEGPFFDGIDVADQQNRHEGSHRAENDTAILFEHFLVNHGPWIEKNHFD